MLDQKKADENFGDKINEFIQRNRKIIFVITGILVVLFVGSIVFLSVRDNLDKKSAEVLEELNRKYDDLRLDILEDILNENAESFINELEAFALKTRGFSGSKAWSILGEVYFDREDWEKAKEAYIKSANTGKRTYLGPMAFFNAAAAAEEQGELEQAIDLLKQGISLNIEFPAAPRAQFSIGRLNEQLGNKDAAIESYREILIKWSDITTWQQLAHSRISALETEN